MKVNEKNLLEYQKATKIKENDFYFFDDEVIKATLDSGGYYKSIEDVHNKYLLALINLEEEEDDKLYCIEVFNAIWIKYKQICLEMEEEIINNFLKKEIAKIDKKLNDEKLSLNEYNRLSIRKNLLIEKQKDLIQ